TVAQKRVLNGLSLFCRFANLDIGCGPFGHPYSASTRRPTKFLVTSSDCINGGAVLGLWHGWARILGVVGTAHAIVTSLPERIVSSGEGLSLLPDVVLGPKLGFENR